MFKLARLTDEQWRRNPAERMRLATLIQEAAAGYYGVFALPYSELLEEIASQILAARVSLLSRPISWMPVGEVTLISVR